MAGHDYSGMSPKQIERELTAAREKAAEEAAEQAEATREALERGEKLRGEQGGQ